MNNAPKHGQHEPSLGWYDSSLDGWINDPTKLTRVVTADEPSAYMREEFARSSWGARKAFRTNADYESLIRLRDSDKAEDRAAFDQLANGRRRVQLHDYETAKAKATESGAE